MALINTGPNYTRTGDNFLTRWGNAASFIPLIGAPIAGALGVIGALVDGAGWLLRGKLGSAFTAVAAGTVSAGINSASSVFAPLEGVRWWLNAGSGVTSGVSLGTHGRMVTESAIGAVTGALGFKPTVLQSYTAGVGSIGGGAARSGPGYYATRAAQERGADPQAMWNQYRSGAGADHVSALEAARAQGQAQRGL